MRSRWLRTIPFTICRIGSPFRRERAGTCRRGGNRRRRQCFWVGARCRFDHFGDVRERPCRRVAPVRRDDCAHFDVGARLHCSPRRVIGCAAGFLVGSGPGPARLARWQHGNILFGSPLRIRTRTQPCGDVHVAARARRRIERNPFSPSFSFDRCTALSCFSWLCAHAHENEIVRNCHGTGHGAGDTHGHSRGLVAGLNADMDRDSFQEFISEIRNCRLCENQLPLGPRPVLQVSSTAQLLIASQAPGTKVHQSGVPFDDDSGRRLRDWMGITEREFYDERLVAIVPMGFCYPGRSGGGDAPPRRECARHWRVPLLSMLPDVRLTLLVGSYAQEAAIGPGRVTERVSDFRDHLPKVFPLPHPSWRSRIWAARNPWFEKEVLPELKRQVRAALSREAKGI